MGWWAAKATQKDTQVNLDDLPEDLFPDGIGTVESGLGFQVVNGIQKDTPANLDNLSEDLFPCGTGVFESGPRRFRMPRGAWGVRWPKVRKRMLRQILMICLRIFVPCCTGAIESGLGRGG